MKIKKIKTIHYEYGEEEKIKKLLYQSKEPILIRIKDFTDQFSLEYFENRIQDTTTYCTFENYHFRSHQAGDFATVISEIKQNKPHRIFGQHLSREQSAEIEKHVPVWQAIPLRPRYFNEILKVSYFFGGKGSCTDIHFDREHCCILHLCLSGKKKLLLFTEDQSDHIYKLPYIGDSLIDFSRPLDVLSQKFPRINQAEGYEVILEQGDMLFMPKNCWHYTQYLEASSSASYVFYPKKILHFYDILQVIFLWDTALPLALVLASGLFSQNLARVMRYHPVMKNIYTKRLKPFHMCSCCLL